MKLKEGNRAPDFQLPDQDNQLHKLSQFQGEWVLLYFYPKDNTPGCTTEACQIRDNMEAFSRLHITVLGVSADSVESHKKFAEKYHLPFSLLADTEKEVIQLYGVWGKKKFMGKEYMGIKRTSFLINREGKIAKIYENVLPQAHAEEVIRDIKVFEGVMR